MSSGLNASVSTSWLSTAPASESSLPSILVEDPKPAKLLAELSIQGKLGHDALTYLLQIPQALE